VLKSLGFHRNANAVALFLEQHKSVSKVIYPGLPSHPQHVLANKQQHGFGAMVTFYCAGGIGHAANVLKKVRSLRTSLIYLAFVLIQVILLSTASRFCFG